MPYFYTLAIFLDFHERKVLPTSGLWNTQSFTCTSASRNNRYSLSLTSSFVPLPALINCPKGANWVSIVVTQYQKMHNTTEIFPLYTPQHSTQPPWFYTFITATDQQLRTIIRDAKKNHNIKVMLKPHIDLTNDDPQYWRGDIGKGFSSADWDQWFASYEKFFLPYARLAEEENVDLLSLSCELIEASLQESHWRAFVPKVRKVKGTLSFFFILLNLRNRSILAV